jgi:FAD/FMN-containing dehydrogenase
VPVTTIFPDDERYEALSQGFNQRWVATPDSIKLVGSTEDVVEVVTEAVRKDQRIGVRSGGHCYENFVCNDEVKVIIDVSQLDHVFYDDTRNAYCAGAGTTNWQLYTHLYRPYGVVLPAGSCYSVGAGGHICGGGFGLLSRQFGLTVDYLEAVEVVVVEDRQQARSVLASRDSTDPDLRKLWWAHTGGGGGNFGVITRYWFRNLPKPPKDVWLSGAQFSWEDLGEEGFHQLVERYGRFFAAHADPTDSYADLFAILKLTHVSKRELGLVVQLDATRPGSQSRLEAFYDAVIHPLDANAVDFHLQVGEHAPIQPLTVQGRVMPWIQATQTLNVSGENRRGKHKSAYHRTAFTPHHIQAFYEHLHDASYANSEALLKIDSYGCAVNKIKSGDTAVAQRDSALKLQYQTYWTDRSEDGKHLDWIRRFYADVYRDTGGVPVPNDITDGCYIGYPDVDLGDPRWNTSGIPWSYLYYKDDYRSLQEVKTRWDPNNIFRHAQSIQTFPTAN